jgi:hypothetical protein
VSDAKTCSRPGCGKTLRANNSTGACATGCRSPDARPSQREGWGKPGWKDEDAPKAPRAVKPAGDALARFRIVAEALGKDADQLLEDFAAAWLAELRGRVE